MFFTFDQFERIRQAFRWECPRCHDEIQLMWIENEVDNEPDIVMWFCPICYARFSLAMGLKMTEPGIDVDKR